MTEEKIGLAALKDAVEEALIEEKTVEKTTTKKPSVQSEQESQTERTAVKDYQGRSYATGRRKDAKARVWVKSGTGKMIINGRDHHRYFARPVLQMILNQPFQVSNRENQFDVFATVTGGGLSGQAGAVKHGISRALTLFEPTLRSPLKAEGFLTRDDRIVERKKYGRRKARRAFQFSKR